MQFLFYKVVKLGRSTYYYNLSVEGKEKVKPKVGKPKGYSLNIVTSSNQIWEMDIKYGCIHGEDKFFYNINVIDIFDRNIIDYHMGLHCEAKDAAALLRKCLIRRNLLIHGVL